MTYSYTFDKESSRTNDSVALGNSAVKTQLFENAEGDFVMTADGDVCIATDTEAQSQKILHALRTHFNSSPVYRNFGTRLRNAFGLPDSNHILEKIQEILIEDLTTSGVTFQEVEVLPLAKEVIMINVTSISISGNPIQGVYLLNTETGYIELQGGLNV